MEDLKAITFTCQQGNQNTINQNIYFFAIKGRLNGSSSHLPFMQFIVYLSTYYWRFEECYAFSLTT